MNIKLIFDTGYELTVDLFDNDFVERWCRLLSQEIARGSLLQEDTYSSFVPESLARQRLEEAIDSVNGFLKREFISRPCVSDYDNRDFYNHLHTQFEKLAGPDWTQPTKLMLVAPEHVKLAIKHINRYCHRLEKRPYAIQKFMRVEFNTDQRHELLEQDYKLFQTIEEPNIAVLDYSTLGKSLSDCFEDGLEADYTGLKLQHHYCANFVLHFATPPRNLEFENWCKNKNIDPIPITELGKMPLGKIQDPNSFEQVKKTAKILSITME